MEKKRRILLNQMIVSVNNCTRSLCVKTEKPFLDSSLQAASENMKSTCLVALLFLAAIIASNYGHSILELALLAFAAAVECDKRVKTHRKSFETLLLSILQMASPSVMLSISIIVMRWMRLEAG